MSVTIGDPLQSIVVKKQNPECGAKIIKSKMANKRVAQIHVTQTTNL